MLVLHTASAATTRLLIGRDDHLVPRVAVVRRHGEVERPGVEGDAVERRDHARRAGQAFGSGQRDLTHLHVDAFAERLGVEAAQVEVHVIVGAAVQHRRTRVLHVDRPDALKGVGHVERRRGDGDGLASGEVAVPLEHPPSAVRGIGPCAVVGEVARVVPVRGLRVDLGVLEHREPLDELAGHAHIAEHPVLGDVDGQRIDAARGLEGAVVREVRAEGRQVVDAELVPDEDVGEHVVRERVVEVVGRTLRLPAGVAGSADHRSIQAIAGIDVADRVDGRLPVAEERVLQSAPVPVPVAAIRLVERDEDVVLRMRRLRGHRLGDELDDFEVVPHAIGDRRVGAVGLVVRAGVAGALSAVVRPVGVVVLDVDVELLAVLVEEPVLDLERVAARMLRAVRRLLRRVGDVGPIDEGARRCVVIAEPVEGSGGAAAELARALREIDAQHLCSFLCDCSGGGQRGEAPSHQGGCGCGRGRGQPSAGILH